MRHKAEMDDPFNPTQPEAIAARVNQLKAKRKAREGNKMFVKNVAAIDEEIARLETLLEADPQPE